MGTYTTAISGVTSGTALKTIIQLAASAANKVEIIEWSLSFNGTNVSAVPVLVQLNRQTSAGTGGVAGLENPHDTTEGAATGVTLTGPTAAVWTAEPTTGLIMYADYFTPVGLGPFIQYPLGRGLILPLSGRIGITVTAAVAVSCAGHITWVE